MSAIAQPVSATAARPARKPSGWSQLKLLLPYVFRYKRMVAVGMVALTLTGLLGSLPQLIIGSITDLLHAAPQPLSTLTGTARAILHPLFAFYAPLSRHALGLYCIILVVVILFLFLGNVRGAIIVALTIPFALLFAAICLNLEHIPAGY